LKTETPDTRRSYEAWHETFREIPDEANLESVWYTSVRSLFPSSAGAGGRVLEVACGTGGFARERARAGEEVFAADFSFVAIQEAVRRSAGMARPPHFLVADAECLPFRSGAFANAISCETIEHVPSPRRFAYELTRVLSPDGRLYLTFPSYLNAMGLYRIYGMIRGNPYSSGVDLQPRENFLLWPFVLRMFQGAGMRLTRFHGAVHLVPCPRRPIIWLKSLDRWRPIARLLSPFALHITLSLRKRPSPRASA
jgi:SAM-dependent methyltransferase